MPAPIHATGSSKEGHYGAELYQLPGRSLHTYLCRPTTCKTARGCVESLAVTHILLVPVHWAAGTTLLHVLEQLPESQTQSVLCCTTLLFVVPYRRSLLLMAVSCSLVKSGSLVGQTQLMQMFVCQLATTAQGFETLACCRACWAPFEHKLCCYNAQWRRLVSYFISLY